MNKDIILFILSFLIKEEGCKKNIKSNLKLISKEINNFFKINCIFFNKYNNKMWCLVHEPNEYKLAKIINKNKVTLKLSTDLLLNDINDNMITYHLNNEDNLKYELKNIFEKVTEFDNCCKISHYCCKGKGVMFKLIE